MSPELQDSRRDPFIHKQSLQTQSEISQEVPRVQKYIARPTLEDLAKSGEARGKWMTDAYQVHGYTMAEIAKHVGVHYSLVSKVIKKWKEDDSRFKIQDVTPLFALFPFLMAMFLTEAYPYRK